jgi:hypothetical protein
MAPVANMAELSSVATQLDELTGRVTAALRATPEDELLAGELEEIERLLRTATRRLERLVRAQ